MAKPRFTALRCLFSLWALPTFKYAFELDVLKFLHQFGYVDYAAKKY